MKKTNSKMQFPNSNRHGQPITNNDRVKIQRVYDEKKIEFEALTEDELKDIQKKNEYYGKRLYGATRLALEHAIQGKFFSKLIKTEDAPAS